MAIGNYLTTTEAATILKVTPMRVRQFVKGGRLTRHDVGRMVLLDKDEVRQFARKKRLNGRPKK